MKKLVSLILALVLVVTCLSGLSFALDPIATVETDGRVTEVTTLPLLQAFIDARGISTVTLLQDIVADDMIKIPVCTLDLNGHTWSTVEAGTNALYFSATHTDVEAENLCAVVKNGTVNAGKAAVSTNVGALRIENATLIANNGTALQLLYVGDINALTKGKCNEGNVIENSTLFSNNYNVIQLNSKNGNFEAVEFTVKNSNLITNSNKHFGFSNAAVKTSGTFVLGNDVNFYYRGGGVVTTSDPAPAVIGEKFEAVEGTFTLEIAGKTLEGFNKSATASAGAAPEVPGTETPAQPETPAEPETPAQPETPEVSVTPEVPGTETPDAPVPATGVSVVALGVMAMVSLAGAVVSKKH